MSNTSLSIVNYVKCCTVSCQCLACKPFIKFLEDSSYRVVCKTYHLRGGQGGCVDDDGNGSVGDWAEWTQVLASRTLPPGRAEALESVVDGSTAGGPGGTRCPATRVDAVGGQLAQGAAESASAVAEEVVGEDVDAQRAVEARRRRRASRPAFQLAVTPAELFQTAARVAVHEVHAAASCTQQDTAKLRHRLKPYSTWLDTTRYSYCILV